MNGKTREEFEAWAPIKHSHFLYPFNRVDGTDRYVHSEVQQDWAVWKASRASPSAIHPLIKCLNENGDLIALRATVAQQAKMIEHLRGGLTLGYTAVDMSTAAAQGFRDGAASAETLRKALAECTASLEAEMIKNYHGADPEAMHPSTRQCYDRDMAEVAEYRAILSKEG